MTQRRIYQSAFPYHIVFNVLNREWIFEDEKKAELLHEIILHAGDLKNYIIYQFCIMPDHVHLLCKTEPPRGVRCGFSHRRLENLRCEKRGVPPDRNVGFLTRGADPKTIRGAIQKHNISDFVKSIRGTFSREINEGQIWQPRFYDEIIKTDEQLISTIDYITHNPITAYLPEKYQQHPYQYKNMDLIQELLVG